MKTRDLKTLYKKVYYRPLHAWNYSNEVPLVDAQLAKRNVHYYFIFNEEQETKVYLIPEEELKKLPLWEGKPYLPVEDDWGHSLFTNKVWEDDYKESEWIEVIVK